MCRPVLVLPLLLVAACAEEDEGTGSVELTGVGLITPWWVLLALLLAAVAIAVRRRRRK